MLLSQFGSLTESERSTMDDLELNGAEIAQSRMFSHAIVKGLDVLKNAGTSLFMGLETLTRSAFALKRSEESFHHRIIPTIAFPTHAHLNPMLLQKALVSFASILAPPIRMV